MGCCVSSDKKFHDSSPKSLTSQEEPSEEKVKEVLSETPKKNPTTIVKSKPQKPLQNTTLHKFKEGMVEKRALSIDKAKDTLNEATFTATSISDQIEETRKRVDRSQAKLRKNLSFPGNDDGRRERRVHGTSNNVGSVRLVQCKERKGQKLDNGGNCRRRDPGENSFRWTRSPATGEARPVLNRSQSARRTIRPVGRVRTITPANGCRKMEIPAKEDKWPSARELLENPFVSLECFIFL